MKNTIFQHDDYKEYLNTWIKAQAAGGHGMRGAFAKAMGCQLAFVSQILSGNGQLSLEQGDKLNHFLSHSKEEAHFFLLLIQYNRAGTKSLQEYFYKQMQNILEARLQLRHRLAHEKLKLSHEDTSKYFSSWKYAAVHVLISIPKFQTKLAIAQALDLESEDVANILEFLVGRGLAEEDGDRFTVGPMHIHLGNDSSMITKHHLNWRLQTMQAIDKEHKDELHYSSVVSISKKDALELKSYFIDAIEHSKKIVAESKEETIYCLSLDFFSVLKN